MVTKMLKSLVLRSKRVGAVPAQIGNARWEVIVSRNQDQHVLLLVLAPESVPKLRRPPRWKCCLCADVLGLGLENNLLSLE
jgi:hypothetical protein